MNTDIKGWVDILLGVAVLVGLYWANRRIGTLVEERATACQKEAEEEEKVRVKEEIPVPVCVDQVVPAKSEEEELEELSGFCDEMLQHAKEAQDYCNKYCPADAWGKNVFVAVLNDAIQLRKSLESKQVETGK